MAPIPLPFSLLVSLTFTGDTGEDPKTVKVVGSGSYTSRVDAKYEISGAGTKVIDFGTLPAAGAKIALVFYEAGSAAVQVVKGTETVELTVGGGLLLFDPAPASGLTALSVTTTAAATLRVVLLG